MQSGKAESLEEQDDDLVIENHLKMMDLKSLGSSTAVSILSTDLLSKFEFVHDGMLD